MRGCSPRSESPTPLVSTEAAYPVSSLWRYALQGHFDFLLAYTTSSIRYFAVEFDRPSHMRNPDTIRRDAMKNTICQRLCLPLLRVDAGLPPERWSIYPHRLAR